MRRALLILVLSTAATIQMPSQSLQQTLIEISNDLTSISDRFDEDLLRLEEQLTSLEATSTVLSTQLADLEPRVESSEESQADLRSSLTRYQTYARTALEAQSQEITALRNELWVYRIGGGALALLTGWLAIRAALAPP
jgi:chromosome segregation ATPase